MLEDLFKYTYWEYVLVLTPLNFSTASSILPRIPFLRAPEDFVTMLFSIPPSLLSRVMMVLSYSLVNFCSSVNLFVSWIRYNTFHTCHWECECDNKWRMAPKISFAKRSCNCGLARKDCLMMIRNLTRAVNTGSTDKSLRLCSTNISEIVVSICESTCIESPHPAVVWAPYKT